MKPAKLALLVGLALLTVAVGSARAEEPAPSAFQPSAAAVAACIEKAEEARRQAAQLGAEWLATLELIEQAREQAELGELQRAMDLAELARTQSELATAQAAREANAWQQRVVR